MAKGSLCDGGCTVVGRCPSPATHACNLGGLGVPLCGTGAWLLQVSVPH